MRREKPQMGSEITKKNAIMLPSCPTNVSAPSRHVKWFHVLLSLAPVICSINSERRRRMSYEKPQCRSARSGLPNYRTEPWRRTVLPAETLRGDHKTFTLRLKWQMSPLIRKQKKKQENNRGAREGETPVETETSISCLEEALEWLNTAEHKHNRELTRALFTLQRRCSF